MPDDLVAAAREALGAMERVFPRAGQPWWYDAVRKFRDTLNAEALRTALPSGESGGAWVLVPREPTPQMLALAGTMEGFDTDREDADDCHISWWEAMIDARPAPSVERPEVKLRREGIAASVRWALSYHGIQHEFAETACYDAADSVLADVLQSARPAEPDKAVIERMARAIHTELVAHDAYDQIKADVAVEVLARAALAALPSESGGADHKALIAEARAEGRAGAAVSPPADGEAVSRPGMGWRLSDAARDKIVQLTEDNTRNASALHSIVLSSLDWPAMQEPAAREELEG